MIYTNANAGASTSLKLEDIKAAVAAVSALPKAEWLLIDDAGNCWKGKPEELLRVLIPHHPLLKNTDISNGLRDQQP